MHKTDAVRLRHMLDAAREAMSFAQGKTRVDLDTDRQLVLALVKEMEIVGEAACQLIPIWTFSGRRFSRISPCSAAR